MRRGTEIFPSQTGGSQEFGLRAGTENVAYIIGMVEALRLTQTESNERYGRLQYLRNHIIDQALKSIPDTLLTGHPQERLPNHASFAFKDVDANTLLMLLDMEGYACSSGSACKTGKPEPSATLTHLGLSSNWAMGSLRVTLGKDTTSEEVNSFLSVLPKVVDKVRNLKKMAI
jgi:cysteine desulfurase